jgi:hypothetical protein
LTAGRKNGGEDKKPFFDYFGRMAPKKAAAPDGRSFPEGKRNGAYSKGKVVQLVRATMSSVFWK